MLNKEVKQIEANSPTFKLPVIGFAAHSGTGKTTLLTQLIPAISSKGIRIGIVKHAHHEFDIDHPGKDSYRLRKAGAAQMLVASSKRIAFIQELVPPFEDPSLSTVLLNLNQTDLDLVLVEGFKKAAIDKIELHRQSLHQPLLYEQDNHIIAVATDSPFQPARQVTILDINDINSIANFIIHRYKDMLPEING